MKKNRLQKGVMPQIVRDYNSNSASVPALQVTQKVAAKKFLPILRLFNRKWHPQEMRKAFSTIFSLDEWKALSEEEKNTHTIQNCTVCSEKFTAYSTVFPTPKRRGKKPLPPPKSTTNIQLLQQDLSSPKALGRKVLSQFHKNDFKHQAKMC